MAHLGAQSGSEAWESAIGSPASTDKYTSLRNPDNWPEVVPQMTQPPLQTSYLPPNHDAYTPQTPYQHQMSQKQVVNYELQKQPKRIPWGLSPLAFGLLVAIITALVVGGAVGGGVAGALSGKNDSSSNVIVETVTVTAGGVSATGTGTGTGTATATSGLPEPSSLTSFTVPEPYYIDSLADPGCQKSRIDVQYGERYDLSCGLDIGSGRTDVDDSSKTVADIVGIFAYSLTDCLYACANVNHFTEYNKQNVVGGVMQSCKSVTWNYNMAASNTSDYANCWLKNGTSSGTQCNNCISGTLV